MCSNNLQKDKFDELDKFITTVAKNQNSLIEVLHKAQSIFGYLSEEVQSYVAVKLNVPVAKVFGVVTFYSYFSTKPRGEYVINVCMGTACFVKGANLILEEFEKELKIKAGETTEDGKFTIEVLRCVGACGLAPVVTINDKVYGHFKKEDVKKVIESYC